MTITEAKNKLVSWANQQISYHEGDNNWNKYAQKWTAAGGWNAQNQPWCDIFVDVGFIEVFGIDLASKLTYQPKGQFSALCSASANYYKNHNAWFSTPEVGDQAFFNVSGGINHTGLVVAVTGSVVTVIEGNSSDSVRKNNYTLPSSYIAGFGRPNWSAVSTETSSTGQTTQNPTVSISQEPASKPSTQSCKVEITLPVVKFGDVSFWVKLMQMALIGRGFNCGAYGTDGDYGGQTKIALYQFQQKNGLEADCICGSVTWKKLLEI